MKSVNNRTSPPPSAHSTTTQRDIQLHELDVAENINKQGGEDEKSLEITEGLFGHRKMAVSGWCPDDVQSPISNDKFVDIMKACKYSSSPDNMEDRPEATYGTVSSPEVTPLDTTVSGISVTNGASMSDNNNASGIEVVASGGVSAGVATTAPDFNTTKDVAMAGGGTGSKVCSGIEGIKGEEGRGLAALTPPSN